MIEVLERLGDYIEKYGQSDLIDFLARRSPRSSSEFIERLSSDIRVILGEIENQADKLQGEGEEKLRDRVLQSLRALGYRASAEEDNRGHTDLLVYSQHVKAKWIGEAKIHRDYDYLADGLRQLLNRYTSGRESTVGLIIFIFQEKANLIVSRWRAKIQDESLCGFCGDFETVPGDRLDFSSKHVHRSSGFSVSTRHFFALLHYSPDDKSARASKALSG